MNTVEIKKILEKLRIDLRNENISYSGLIQLQALSQYIDKGDIELLQAAGVPESEAK
jgi:hypothetical protein